MSLALSGLKCLGCFDFVFSIIVTVIGFYDFEIHTINDDITFLPFGTPDLPSIHPGIHECQNVRKASFMNNPRIEVPSQYIRLIFQKRKISYLYLYCIVSVNVQIVPPFHK